VLVVQVLSAAFFEQNGEIVICFNICFNTLPVDKEEGEDLIFLDGFVEKFLLDVRPDCSGIGG
jgi:hypothetical protein